MVDRPRHVRHGPGRQCLEPGQERRTDQDQYDERGVETDHLRGPEEPWDLRHRYRFRGRTILYIWREGKIGIFDPRTIEYAEYKTPTPQAGPRRGQVDAQDRLWAGEFFAGQVLMFDPDKKVLKEYPLINGAKPYTAPYGEPYSASADSKNQIVWTHDFAATAFTGST